MKAKSTVKASVRPAEPCAKIYDVTIQPNNTKHFCVKSSQAMMDNGRVDAAARIQSSIAGPIKLQNTQPPLASNDLLGTRHGPRSSYRTRMLPTEDSLRKTRACLSYVTNNSVSFVQDTPTNGPEG